MTIQWGSFSGGLRVGIQIESTSAVNNGSTTCTVTVSFWVGTSSSQTFSDNQTLHMSQSGGTSISDTLVDYFNGLSQNQSMKVGPNQTVVYTYSDYGVAHSVTISANADGLFNGGTPSKSISASIPARPWANAAATTAAAVSRTSDTQAAVSWTNHDTASAAYNNIKLYRSTDGGAYALVATLGVVSSYNDTTISANHKYLYRPNVLGKNGVEVTGDVTDTPIWTTPGAPTACTATKQANNDVLVTWTNHVNYAEYLTEIQESTDGGTNWSNLNTSIASGVSSFTHVAPSTGVTHTYRVRAKTSSGTLLTSAYSAQSNTITLLSTAGAPTGLSPSGVARDAASAITLSWTHNPTDGTPQSKRRVQAKINAGSYADLVNDSSTVSSFTVTGGTWTNGDTITWKVATAGQNGTLSAFSAESTITLSAKPTATISAPGASYNNSHLVVDWSYFQAQSSAQAAWVATLLDGSDNVLETRSDTTAATEATFATPLADGGSYSVSVVVTSAAGLTSAPGVQAFTVTYLPPAAVAIAGAFDDTAGSVALTITGDNPVVGVTEAISTVDVQRSLDGGLTWVTIATGIVLAGDPLIATVVDALPITVGTNTYRAVAFSALPSSVMSSTDDVVTSETTWGYLSTGDGFGTVARFRATPTYAVSTARAKALYHFAGRPKPVQLVGEALTTTLSVSGGLSNGSGGVADFEALGLAEGVVCWRGPDGRRLFASLDKMTTGVTRLHELPTIAFALTEVDFSEGDQ